MQLQSLAEALGILTGVSVEKAFEEKEMLLLLSGILRRSGILLFAGSAAFQDLKHRSIALKTFIIFSIWGMASVGLRIFLADRSQEILLPLREPLFFLAPFLPGLLLLILSKVLRGAVGSGDAFYFLTAACFLSLGELIWILCTGLLFCVAAGLVLIFRGRMYDGNRRRFESIPLPFATVVFPAVCAAVLL